MNHSDYYELGTKLAVLGALRGLPGKIIGTAKGKWSELKEFAHIMKEMHKGNLKPFEKKFLGEIKELSRRGK